MKRVMFSLTVAVFVALASFGAAYACGDHAKAKAAVAKADAKDGAVTADHAAKGGCGKSAALVAKADGNVQDAAEAKPCAGAGEGTGCGKKAKAVDIAKAEPTKPVEVAENQK